MLTPCIPFIGATNKTGYGILPKKVNGSRLAHRAALAESLGRPLEANALHHCDNPPCVNPEHLYEGTHADNIEDKVRRNRARGGKFDITHCKHGHALTGDNVQTYERPSTRSTFTARRCMTCRRANNIKLAAKRKAQRAERAAIRKAS